MDIEWALVFFTLFVGLGVGVFVGAWWPRNGGAKQSRCACRERLPHLPL